MSIPMTLGETPVRPHLVRVVAATVGVCLAVALLRCLPFRVVLIMARGMKAPTWRAGGRAELQRIIAARDWAVSWFPGRATCLDQSLAAFLSCVFAGIKVDWCIGCRFGPCESHAWIEHDDHPIGEDFLFDSPYYVTLRV